MLGIAYFFGHKSSSCRLGCILQINFLGIPEVGEKHFMQVVAGMCKEKVSVDYGHLPGWCTQATWAENSCTFACYIVVDTGQWKAIKRGTQ